MRLFPTNSPTQTFAGMKTTLNSLPTMSSCFRVNIAKQSHVPFVWKYFSQWIFAFLYHFPYISVSHPFLCCLRSCLHLKSTLYSHAWEFSSVSRHWFHSHYLVHNKWCFTLFCCYSAHRVDGLGGEISKYKGLYTEFFAQCLRVAILHVLEYWYTTPISFLNRNF